MKVLLIHYFGFWKANKTVLHFIDVEHIFGSNESKLIKQS